MELGTQTETSIVRKKANHVKRTVKNVLKCLLLYEKMLYRKELEEAQNERNFKKIGFLSNNLWCVLSVQVFHLLLR